MVNFNAKFSKRWGANDDSERFTFKFGNVDIPSADFLNRILIFQCCVVWIQKRIPRRWGFIVSLTWF